MSAGIHFAHVTCRFGRRTALRDFSLDCPQGTITCLIGPNGAGKSTALAVAVGLLAPASGDVTVGDAPVRIGRVLAETAYLPQQSAFPSAWSVREAFDFAVAARGTDPAAAEQLLQVTGLGPGLNDRIGRLSAGWIRRVGIATALMPPAGVLVLDEPFVGLDPATLDAVLGYLVRRADEGATLLLASHEFEIIDRLNPRLVALDEGATIRRSPGGEPARSFYGAAFSPSTT